MSTVETWLGPFTVLVDEDGAVLASGWTGDASVLVPLIHRRLRGAGDPVWRRDLGGVTRAVLDYHEGDLRATQACDVRQHSDGQFLATAWKALREVEPGSPISYAQLADRTGSPTASRAAAQACARNAAALFVPCHRIVRTDGSLGGFRWSIQTKQRLLAHESGAAATRT
ncbi:MAG TPA: methylated-DNA--[protein]-cysteine S-methyltransferase [Micromonosporaceae bacterium]